MRAEHLCQWLIDTTRDDSPESTNWKKVVAIVQAELWDGTMVKECTCQTVVLIPKSKRSFRGVELVEVLWKTLARLMNHQLTSSITFHYILQGFLAGCGTGNAALGQYSPPD